jgi:hypothetical protein
LFCSSLTLDISHCASFNLIVKIFSVTRSDYELFCSNLFHLACDIGLRPAGRSLGISESKALKIAWRRKWRISAISPAIQANQRANAKALAQANAQESSGIEHAREIKSRILGQYSDRTKLGLARTACTASEELAEYPGKAILNAQTAIAMEQVSRTADRVHGWSAERAKPLVQIANVTLPSAAEREDREKAHRALDDIARALKLRD